MRINIMVIPFWEDDPLKNTALKMVRKNLARIIKPREIRGKPIILNPFSTSYLGPWDRVYVENSGIIVVDASWRKLSSHKFTNIRGVHVKIPPLLPANPINYGKPCILSSIEAVAASLYITGFREEYEKVIKLYKWLTVFHELNNELLREYSTVKSYEDLLNIINEYWEIDPCGEIDISEK
ncbi:MAG: DUF367 family protein [Desulfurococcaceae archaeon]